MRRVVRHSTVIVMALLLLSGCSGSESGASGTEDQSSCEASAQGIVDRFDEFLVPYSNLTPEEFLAADLDGLSEFQNDIAETVVEVATNPNDECTELDLESEVERALANYAGQGTLNQYLVGLVRQGVEVESRDVVVNPDDDLVAILSALGPGSSVTFGEGVFTLDASILVQGDLVLIGAGPDETILESSADTAAVAVLGGGSMVMNDFTIRHIGDAPASVLVAVDSSLELVNMTVAGGQVDDDGGGGSGVVLTESDQANAQASVTIDKSAIIDNASAGIAVTGSFTPQILNTMIESNGQCGICFFDDAAGQVQSSTLQGNAVGIQTSNRSSPELSLNMFINNDVAGLLIEDESNTGAISNTFEGAETVAIDVQGSSMALLEQNTIGVHAVGISLRDMSQATASNNTITGADVGILVGGGAQPTVFDNDIDRPPVAGILHTDTSTGEFTTNRLTAEAGAGVVVEGQAAPEHVALVVDGGLVGVVFRETSTGLLRDATLTGQQVGIETNDQASPIIESNTIVEATEAAVIFGGDSTALFQGNVIDMPAAIGIQAGGTSSALIQGNQLTGGDTAMLVTESSTPQILENIVADQNFGIGVSAQGAPIIERNEIRNAAAGAMSFEGESTGTVRNNTIVDAGVVGIRIAGTADPEIESNQLFALVPGTGNQTDEPADDAIEEAAPENDGDTTGDPVDAIEDDASGAGLLYADQAIGVARDNQVFGFIIGIQVSDEAAPSLQDNLVDGAGLGGVGLLYGGAGRGTAQGNSSINQQLGVQLSGTTAPVLTDNTVENATVAAFLIQGESTVELVNNECLDNAVDVVVLEEAEPVLESNTCTVQ